MRFPGITALIRARRICTASQRSSTRRKHVQLGSLLTRRYSGMTGGWRARKSAALLRCQRHPPYWPWRSVVPEGAAAADSRSNGRNIPGRPALRTLSRSSRPYGGKYFPERSELLVVVEPGFKSFDKCREGSITPISRTQYQYQDSAKRSASGNKGEPRYRSRPRSSVRLRDISADGPIRFRHDREVIRSTAMLMR